MNRLTKLGTAPVALLLLAAGVAAQDPQDPSLLERMQQTVDELNGRIAELERAELERAELERAARGGGPALQQPAPQGRPSPVRDRDGLYDRQAAAARLDDLTLDPEYHGFIPVPNTGMLIRFNAKPRLDATFDNRNTGNRYRFVPSMLPVTGDPDHGGDGQFNLNANGTQMSLDIRAPDAPGAFRFYYQNHFFGSETADGRYQLQHAYGQYYNIIAGHTFSVFEDPDIWPDTVDYEGPNAAVFARRPVIHYQAALADEWNATVGIEKPDVFVDTSADPDATRRTRMPDLGFNLRWERSGVGHAQFSAIARSIGANSPVFGNQTDFGWGVNLSCAVDVTDSDTVQVLVVGGEGIGGMGNDTSFEQSDGGYDANGDLVALPYHSGLIGVTHHWDDQWRSTATYGYAEIDNVAQQAAGAFHASQYASLNLIHQIGPRLSVGVEGLYGWLEEADGRDGDALRLQFSLVYSIF